MIDLLRPGVREAVQTCRKSGVGVSMVTGDHRVTALAIARDLDLAHDESEVITGPELTETSPEELAEVVGRVRVFARVAPRQKLQIVEAARQAGHIVAVTGDGVNDAPALRVANIGVRLENNQSRTQLTTAFNRFSLILSIGPKQCCLPRCFWHHRPDGWAVNGKPSYGLPGFLHSAELVDLAIGITVPVEQLRWCHLMPFSLAGVKQEV